MVLLLTFGVSVILRVFEFLSATMAGGGGGGGRGGSGGSGEVHSHTVKAIVFVFL